MNKNIAIIIPSLLSGGAEKQSVFLANILCENYNVFFIVLKGDLVEQKFLQRLNTKRIKLIRLKGTIFKNTFEIHKFLITNNVSVSFSYLASGNLLSGLAGLMAGIKYRVGGIRSAVLPKSKVLVEKISHNYLLTGSISNSYSAVENLSKKGFNKDKFTVIHNAFELKQHPIYRNKHDVVIILSVARFVPPKDFYTSLKAIRILYDKNNDLRNNFKYNIVGYGEQENEIRKWVNDLGLNKIVNIYIKPDNLEYHYKNADVFLTTSLFEGLSNSVMEAMSFSLPVVATPAGDMEYLVKEGENGYLCEMKNPTEIADKLTILINNYELRKEMGLKSYNIISKDFTLDKFKKHYISFINKLDGK